MCIVHLCGEFNFEFLLEENNFFKRHKLFLLTYFLLNTSCNYVVKSMKVNIYTSVGMFFVMQNIKTNSQIIIQQMRDKC